MVLEESSAKSLDHQQDERAGPEPMKPETALEATTTKPKPSYFRHIRRRQGSLEKS